MKIRQFVCTLALSACVVLPTVAQTSSLVGRSSNNTPVAAGEPKGKTVKITLKNKTNAPIDLIVNDKTVTIAANSEFELKAPAGTDVYSSDRTLVKLHVTNEMNGNAVSFR